MPHIQQHFISHKNGPSLLHQKTMKNQGYAFGVTVFGMVLYGIIVNGEKKWRLFCVTNMEMKPQL